LIGPNESARVVAFVATAVGRFFTIPADRLWIDWTVAGTQQHMIGCRQ
jgi:hypothetical protein